jgi:sodium transport system ATP-binding protein
MIEVKGLCKHFGNIRAVQNISFIAQPGRVTGLLGTNGAGKTTTMRMICGAIRPNSGLAQVCGIDVGKNPQRVRRVVGVLPDARGLYERLSAREHLLYFGRLHGMTGGALRRRADTLIELLDMTDIADRRTKGFSQGQRARVAIGRALIHDPPAVILDEPTNGLDVGATLAMRGVIKLLKEEGKTVLLSTHMMQEVAALCDDVVVLARGEVVAEGSPDGLIQRSGSDTLEQAFMALTAEVGTP